MCRCASNRTQLGQAASKCRNGAFAYGLSRLSPHGGPAKARTPASSLAGPAGSPCSATQIDGEVVQE